MDHDTIDYRGYTIAIEHDDYPDNPFTDWDGETPLLAAHLSRGCGADITGYGLDRDPPTLTRDQVKAHGTAIAIETGERSLLAAIKNHARYPVSEYSGSADAVNCAIENYAQGITNGSDLTAFLAQCWTWAGCTALDTSTQGYSQGDYADLLLVATPQWLELTGVAPEDAMRCLEGAARLYGYWAWGDVYGYQVTDPDGEETEHSCWGFYGDDHEASGLLDQARSDIDSEIHDRRRNTLALRKTQIMHRVPLEIRAGV